MLVTSVPLPDHGYERDGSMRHIAILCGNGGLFLDYDLS